MAALCVYGIRKKEGSIVKCLAPVQGIKSERITCGCFKEMCKNPGGKKIPRDFCISRFSLQTAKRCLLFIALQRNFEFPRQRAQNVFFLGVFAQRLQTEENKFLRFDRVGLEAEDVGVI